MWLASRSELETDLNEQIDGNLQWLVLIQRKALRFVFLHKLSSKHRKKLAVISVEVSH